MTNVNGVIAAISGLGYIFINKGLIASVRRVIIKRLYQLSLNHHNLKIICQNDNDLQIIREITGLNKDTFSMISGSGVPLEKFKFILW